MSSNINHKGPFKFVITSPEGLKLKGECSSVNISTEYPLLYPSLHHPHSVEFAIQTIQFSGTLAASKPKKAATKELKALSLAWKKVKVPKKKKGKK